MAKPAKPTLQPYTGQTPDPAHKASWSARCKTFFSWLVSDAYQNIVKTNTYSDSAMGYIDAALSGSSSLVDAVAVLQRIPNEAYWNSPSRIGDGKNLNNYQSPGLWYQSSNSSAASGSNYPEDKAGALMVYKTAGVTQIYLTYNDGMPEMYQRGYYNGNWSVWRKFYHDGHAVWDAGNFDPNSKLGANAKAVSARNADKVGNLSASSFLRSDVNDKTTGLIIYGRPADEQIRLGYQTGAARSAYISFYDGDSQREGYIQALNDRMRLNNDGGAQLDLVSSGVALVNGGHILHSGKRFGTIGTLCFAEGATAAPGGYVKGSSLRPTTGNGEQASSTLSGTWQLWGNSPNGGHQSLWFRVS